MRRNISTDNNGISAIVVVVILLVAAVAAVGAYVVLKDNSEDDVANETILESKLGVGTVLYYDEIPVLGSLMTTSNTIGIAGELIGESGTHYFFEYGDGVYSYIIVKIHKETGAIDSASEVDGKWVVEITNQDGDEIKAEMTIGQLGNYGNVVSTIIITMNDRILLHAEVRSSGHAIVEPSEYEQSEYFGKYHKYDIYSLTSMVVPDVFSLEIEMTGYSKVTVVGTAANDTVIVLMEGYIKIEASSLLGEDMEFYFKEYSTIEDIYAEVPEIPDETLDLKYEGTKRITVAGKNVQAKEYTFSVNIDNVDMSGTIYMSTDDRIIYLYEMDGSSQGVSVTMSVEYVEGNL